MIYATVKMPAIYKQMTLEDLLFNREIKNSVINAKEDCTRTYELEYLSQRFKSRVDVNHLLFVLKRFNEQTEYLRQMPRHDLYREFYIPKRSGGLRKIDAPEPSLMGALRNLKDLFERDFSALYHTSAFAYIKHRCTIDAVKRHQQNESKWFAKFDLSKFFDSTTMDFVLGQFKMLFPFCLLWEIDGGVDELRKALDLAFLDGGLPQGTPISPLITNLMMIPVDFKLSNALNKFNNQHYVYTRYADDFIISSKYDFKFRDIENLIKDTLSGFSAPFTVNEKKTRYGSSSGSNYNLGVLLTSDNKITVGSKKKKQFQAMIFNYLKDRENGIHWSVEDLQVLDGIRAYYTMVEGETINELLKHIAVKFNNINVIQTIRNDLKGV